MIYFAKFRANLKADAKRVCQYVLIQFILCVTSSLLTAQLRESCEFGAGATFMYEMAGDCGRELLQRAAVVKV